MKKALISGITGQDGSYLAEFLLKKGYKVYGMVRRSSTENFERINHIIDDIELRQADLLDQLSIIDLVKSVKPDEVYNLASQSFVPTSWVQPVLTGEFTAIGVTRMLDAIRHIDRDIRFYQASSSEMFGKVRETPQNEHTPFYPRSPYGVAKCLSPRAQIYTDGGLKNISQVKIGDKVWTHTGQLKRVMKIFKRKYDGEMVNIRVSSSSGRSSENIPQTNYQLSLTPEHPVLTIKGWKVASELKSGDIVAVVATKCKNCGKLIPANRIYCSVSCTSKYNWATNKKYRENIVKVTRKRFKEVDYFHTPKAIRYFRLAVAKRLTRNGMNHMEFYLDLLIQQCAPGFFEFVGDGKVCVDGYFPDWINRDKKAIVEFVGYGETYERRQKQFRRRLKKLNSNGYKILVIYGSEFDKPEIIKGKISQFVSDLGSLEFIYIPIISVTRFKHKNNNYVYNMEVDEDNSYIANGIAVHNCYGHYITVNYRESYGIFACSGILFNHESPRRGKEFVSRKVTYGASRIKLGLDKKLLMGNLNAKRDWGYAGDYVEAMWLMLQQKKPGDYVIATGETHTVRELVEIAFKHLGLDWRDHVVVDKKHLRPADVNLLIGDATKARKELGWRPRVQFRELIRMMTDADMAALEKELRNGK